MPLAAVNRLALVALLAVTGLLVLVGCFNQSEDRGIGGGYSSPLVADALIIAAGNNGVTSIGGEGFTDPGADFQAGGVLPGDALVIQGGTSWGEYVITGVSQSTVNARGLSPVARESGLPYFIKGKRVFFSGIDGYLYALGETALSREAERMRSEGASAGPVIAGTPNEADGFLYAVESGTVIPRRDGKIGWRRPEGRDRIETELVGSPVLDRSTNTVLVGSEDGGLYAYDAATGEPRDGFPFQAGDKIWSTPAVRDGVVYFGSHDKKVYAVFLSSGEMKWEYTTGGVVAGPVLLFRDQVIAGSFDRKLYSLSMLDGALRWSVDGDNWFWAGAVDDGRTIFAPSMDGNVYAVDGNGAILWKHDMGSPIVSTPVLTSQGLVVAGKNGTISVLDTRAGEIGMQRVIYSPTPRDADILAPIDASAGSIFVGADDSTVSRLDIASRKQIWCHHTEEPQCN